MPSNTTNQQITLPIGVDLADNPLAFTDMIADVENRLVQRYTSTADRTARNPAPTTNELSIVGGNTWYDRWTGAKWIPVTTISSFKAADQTINNSTTLVNVTSMAVALPLDNTNYTFRCGVRYSSSTVADIKFTFTGPAGATIVFGGPSLDVAAVSAVGSANFAEAIAPAVLTSGGTGGIAIVTLNGTVATAGAAGVLQLQFAQNTLEATNTTVNAFSWIQAWAIS